jgi:hypothetical protein
VLVYNRNVYMNASACDRFRVFHFRFKWIRVRQSVLETSQCILNVCGGSGSGICPKLCLKKFDWFLHESNITL